MTIGCEIFDPNEAKSAEELIHFWVSQGILNKQEAANRCKEAVVVARGADRRIYGVLTSVNRYIPILKHYCYFTRFSLRSGHGSTYLPIKMGRVAYDYLLKKSNTEHDKPIGLFAIVQNDKIKQLWNYASWPKMPFVYLGNTPEGHQRRVLYFEHSRLTN